MALGSLAEVLLWALLAHHPSFGKTHVLPFLVFRVGQSVIAIYLPFLYGTTCLVHSLCHYSQLSRNISEGESNSFWQPAGEREWKVTQLFWLGHLDGWL